MNKKYLGYIGAIIGIFLIVAYFGNSVKISDKEREMYKQEYESLLQENLKLKAEISESHLTKEIEEIKNVDGSSKKVTKITIDKKKESIELALKKEHKEQNTINYDKSKEHTYTKKGSGASVDYLYFNNAKLDDPEHYFGVTSGSFLGPIRGKAGASWAPLTKEVRGAIGISIDLP